MKLLYRDLLTFLSDSPSIEELSDVLFQLGHEHEVIGEIFDMELTPNRGDCLSLEGIARDLNYFFKKIQPQEIYQQEIPKLELDFENLSEENCPKISFLEIEVTGNISSYQSYLENYFTKLGNKKVNFFTDISNYLSYECGQPTHCYDREKIDNKIIFEEKNLNTEFQTLIGSKISLKGKNCYFAMGDKVINLAGVMGGLSTACSEQTKKVIVECAYFKPASIIGKSLKYNLFTDAAYKFERGVDISSQERTLRRFISIVQDHVETKSLRLVTFDSQQLKTGSININHKKINNILGTDISETKYLNILEKLEFKITDKIHIPSHRHDIKTHNDISEEIARVIGYDNIANQALEIPKKDKSTKLDLANSLRILLAREGFNEVINFPFSNSKNLKSILIDNPLDSNRSSMRIGLKESLIENLIYNERRQKDTIKFFEVSDIYSKDGKASKVGIIASGRIGDNHRDFSRKIDKKYLHNIFKNNLGLDVEFSEIQREEVGSKKKSKIFYSEIGLDELSVDTADLTNFDLKNIKFIKYSAISDFPSSSRDFSFSITDSEKVQEVIGLLGNIDFKYLKKSFIFDFYNNQKTGEIKIGCRFIFQSYTKTLTEKDINMSIQEILKPIIAIESVSIPGL
tara:strand:- start:12835 stop:14724 length:1890 start_codon:yes stop_codon:yes gene_type:complete